MTSMPAGLGVKQRSKDWQKGVEKLHIRGKQGSQGLQMHTRGRQAGRRPGSSHGSALLGVKQGGDQGVPTEAHSWVSSSKPGMESCMACLARLPPQLTSRASSTILYRMRDSIIWGATWTEVWVAYTSQMTCAAHTKGWKAH